MIDPKAEELAGSPRCFAEVPAHAPASWDRDAIKRLVFRHRAAEGVHRIPACPLGVAPALKGDRLDLSAGSDFVGDFDCVASCGYMSDGVALVVCSPLH